MDKDKYIEENKYQGDDWAELRYDIYIAPYEADENEEKDNDTEKEA